MNIERAWEIRTYMAKRKDTNTEMLKVGQIIEDAPWNKENAIQDARAYDIPVFDLGRNQDDVLEDLITFIGEQ